MNRSHSVTLHALTLAALLAVPAAATSQQLTVQRIFGSADFRTRSLPELTWIDGERYSYVRTTAGGATDLIVVRVSTGEESVAVSGAELVPTGAATPLAIEEYAWGPDEQRLLIFTNSQRVWRQNTKGTYYVFDVGAKRLTPLSSAPGWQMFAKFSPDGRQVGFVRDNDLFVADLETGRETRLTSDGSENVINGTFDWVYEEELDLRDGWRWSPDSRRIAFWQLDQSDVATFYMIDDLPLYSSTSALRYPKAGERNSTARIGVVAAGGGPIRWIETGTGDDYLARMEWASSPTELVIQRLNRQQNRLEVLLADAATGAARVLFTETDRAWVDVDDDLTWIGGGRQFVWSSERDGYNHLYLYGRDGRLVRQLTNGPWDVTSFYGVDEAGGRIYYASTQVDARERHVYRSGLSRGSAERLTREAGAHSASFAPTFAYWIGVRSANDTPPITTLRRADGTVLRTLVDNEQVAARYRAVGIRPEFFSFRTSDGTELNGWMMKPPGFDPSRAYPVLMYVYGGPGSQTVLNSWGGNRQLWHTLLAERGYLVVSVDNRGTGGRGAAFKKVTYMDLGAREAGDQIEAARWLATQPYVDADRIGLWGWSYGGYMTTLTMGLGGELFDAGIAVAPVTDWRLYDTIYTERFMRTPQENPEGYRRSAPLAHVPGIAGDLLVIHGTGDDNVHFQNTVQLVNTLQQAGKQFDLMIYPNRTHSISGGSTQVHLYTLMTSWVLEHL